MVVFEALNSVVKQWFLQYKEKYKCCVAKPKTKHTKHEVLTEFFQVLNQKRRKTHLLKNPNHEAGLVGFENLEMVD